jgi:hypothetical protein
VTNSTAPNRFGAYIGEILRAEGLNAFDSIQLSSLTSTNLAQYKVVILTETPLNASQVTLFTNYVSNGGRLLASRPDTQLAALFGLNAMGSAQSDGYLKIEGATSAGQGLPTETLQIHGAADRYTLNGAAVIATLYSHATTATTHPAVVTSTFGSGRTAAFTYDLATNIVMMRQGNPANANVDTDSDGVLRTIDLFQGSGGGQPWVNRDRIHIPQTDVQQRLFARLVHQLVEPLTPLPQLWYFPGAVKAMLIPTGDAHANPLSYYSLVVNSVNARNGKITIYMSKGGGIEGQDPQVQAWRGQGHEFGIHPYANKPDNFPTPITNLQQGYDDLSGADGNGGWFDFAFSSAKSKTVRNHQVAWQGWTDAAEIAIAHGIELDTNFYHWGPWLQKPNNTWPHGYITGSGQPMKFIKADGTILPLYQQLTQLVDEQLLGVISGAGYEGLNATQAFNVSKQLIDASIAGDYAALMTQFHVDYYNFGVPQEWAEATMDYANQQGVPIWNADEWLAFTKIRHDANFQNINWDSVTGQLSFSMSAANASKTLSVLLPLTFDGRNLTSVLVDGNPQSFSTFTISGRQLALINVSAGNHTFNAGYGTQASTSTPTSTPSPTSTATNTSTNTPSPTSTATNTSTNTPSPTSTATSTPTSTSSPTNTATSTPTSMPTSTPIAATNTPTNTPTSAPTSTPGSSTTGTGLQGEYFDNRDLTALKLTRIDSTVNFSWGTGSPNVLIGPDTFSVRWTGQVMPQFTETYTFYTRTDDGARLWVNGQLLVDKWVNQSTREWNGAIALQAGVKYDIRFEYYENTGGANARLSWASVSQPKQVIPRIRLFPPTVPVNTPTATHTPTSTPTFTALPTNTPTSTPTNTPTATSALPTSTLLPTNTPGPTNTPMPGGGSLTQTTLADFTAACAVASDVIATRGGDGALRLAGSFADPFDGPTLNTVRWASGTWNGGSFAPTPNGTATLEGPNGAWLRSQPTFTRQSLEALVTFGAAPWQHVGFGADGFEGNRYLLFSTVGTTDRLYARTNNNGSEQRTDLGPLPGGPAHLRIEWVALNVTTDQIRYFLDGVLVATHAAPTLPGLYAYLSHNGQGVTPPLVADYLDITPPHGSSGSYTSCALDAGQSVIWSQIALTADMPIGASVGVEVRTSGDGAIWSVWEAVGANGAVNAPSGRFLQYRLSLVANDPQTSPVIQAVNVTYQ